MTLALVSGALAFGSNDIALIEACAGDVAITWPEAGSRDVAVDTMPMAVAAWCTADSVVARLYAADELVFEERFEADAATYGVVEADVELEPETSYLWEITPSTGEAFAVEFETGTRLLEPSEDPPVASIVGDSWSWRNSQGWVSVSILPGAQPEGDLAVFELRDGDEVVERGLQWTTGDAGFVNLDFQGERPGEVCVTPSQRQPDGLWVEGEEVCQDQVGGCSTGAGAAALLPSLLGLVGLLGLRRRR